MPGDLQDSATDFDEIDYEAIAEFFDKEGAIELISLLDENIEDSYRFDEIDEKLDISRGYLDQRRREAFDLGLIMPNESAQDGSVRRVWTLAPVGVYVHRLMVRVGLSYTHSQLIDIREDYDEKKPNSETGLTIPRMLKTISVQCIQTIHYILMNLTQK